MLEAHDLACIRGDRRLFRGLGLAVAPGQVLRVAGPNGAGKTSLLRQLAGLALPHAGAVHWQGRPVLQQREAYAQDLFYLGHLPGLKDDLTPLENLRADAALAGQPGDDHTLVQALAAWGLARQQHLPVRVLSAGQRRRTALARLALGGPRLWILDEPFNALDGAAVEHLGLQIRAHAARGGLAVVTSHQPLPLPEAAVRTLELAA